MTNKITNEQAADLISLVREAINIGKAGTDVEPLTEMGLSAQFAAVLDLEVVKPRFTHDCTKCVFLGHADGEHRRFDLWFHSGQNSVIARYGDDGEDYTSMPVSAITEAMQHTVLFECRRRAMMRGLHRPEGSAMSTSTAERSKVVHGFCGHCGRAKEPNANYADDCGIVSSTWRFCANCGKPKEANRNFVHDDCLCR